MDAYSQNKQNIHCSHHRDYQYLWCPEIHEELPVRLTGQDQRLGLVSDFPRDKIPITTTSKTGIFQFLYTHNYQNPASCLLAKPTLVYSLLLFQYPRVSLLRASQLRWRFLLPTTSPYWFLSSTSRDLLSSLALLGVLALVCN